MKTKIMKPEFPYFAELLKVFKEDRPDAVRITSFYLDSKAWDIYPATFISDNGDEIECKYSPEYYAKFDTIYESES